MRRWRGFFFFFFFSSRRRHTRSLRDWSSDVCSSDLFLEAARKGQLSFGVFHVLGPSIASLDEISEIAPFVNDFNYFLVKNFINNTTFFDWDPATYNAYFKKVKGTHEITIPHLNEMACEQVELASVPFVTFVANKTGSGEGASYSFVL